jgi:acyl-homoserine lactone acylase PvdQ
MKRRCARGRAPWCLLALAALTCLGLAPSAHGAPTPGDYGEDDFGGFHNILPPGQGQTVNSVDLGLFLTLGQRPPHDHDQFDMYNDLVYNAPGVTPGSLEDFFKDATFGTRPNDVQRTYRPRGDVTIVRDNFGVPHIYGADRAGAIFGAGYIAAEDRLFFIDALRHAGRGELASFAGGALGNREMDRGVWADTPYREAELQMQYDLGDDLYGAAGAQLQEDAQNFVAGINQYIAEARINPLKMPAEYAPLGHVLGPQDFKVTDVISIASLVAGIFGKGGGNEVNSALVLEAAQKRFGKREGMKVWKDFRSANDPEAPTTVHKQRFPYGKVTKKARKSFRKGLPDRGTTEHQNVVVASQGGAQTQSSPAGSKFPDVGDLLGNLRGLGGGSNALLVSGSESESGRPVAVMGPQVSYFSPQILLEMDIHAPGGPAGPPLDARGTAFPGTNLYVQLGHGRDYAWSATSAGQDIIDTFAVRLCEPDGSAPTIDSMHYRFRGDCLPIDVLTKVNAWTQSIGDATPSGSETYRAERTALGIVTHRALIKGKPVAFTKLRATYFHEVDGALGFSDFNNPEAMESPAEFMQAACKIDYTFNWFYADNSQIAYFNSGANQVRSRRAHPDLPTPGKPGFEWRNWTPPSPDILNGGPLNPANVNPRTNLSAQEPCAKHPQAVDQKFLTSWNNKQARAYRASDAQWGYGSLYRSLRLDRRVRSRIKGARKVSLPELVDAMEDAGTVDLRGQELVPLLAKVLKPKRLSGELKSALNTLIAWNRSGGHRRDKNRDGTYEDAEAVRIMDAWWPRLVAAEFKPKLGNKLFERVEAMIKLHDAPRDQGSAFQDGWYGYVHKDLRTILGKKVKGRYSRVYCGGGKLRKCRKALRRSLAEALDHTSDAELYPGQPNSACGGQGDAQWCNDAVRYRATGAITQPPMHWIDRPTFQQAVEVQGHR